jgi:hypothetical protein
MPSCGPEAQLSVVTDSRAFRTFGSGLLVVVLVAAALSGCGSNDETGPNTGTTTSDESSLGGWAQGLCTSVAEWQGSVKTTSTKMANSKADFASASEAINSANDALVANLKGLGTPPAPATTAANDVIDELSADLEDESGQIEQDLSGVSTQSQIVTASSQVRASISKITAISPTQWPSSRHSPTKRVGSRPSNKSRRAIPWPTADRPDFRGPR